jgi:hypothetical protein
MTAYDLLLAADLAVIALAAGLIIRGHLVIHLRRAPRPRPPKDQS